MAFDPTPVDGSASDARRAGIRIPSPTRRLLRSALPTELDHIPLFCLRMDTARVFAYNLIMFSGVVDELVGLSDDELTARIEANELERRRIDAEMSAALSVATARNLYGVAGHRSMAAFCRARLNWSTAEAGRRLGLAQAVDDVAGLGEAWMAGHVGYPQALKLSITNGNNRVSDRLPEFTPQFLEHAEKMPYRDFATAVDHFVQQADEDGAHDDRDRAIEGRSARVVDVGGEVDVRASGGDGLTSDELTQIHKEFVDAEYHADVDARRLEHGDDADAFPLPRTEPQRRFDALVAIFRAATAARAAGITGAPPKLVVNIVIDAHTWGRLLVAAGLAANNDLDGNPLDPFTGLPVSDLDQLLGDVVKTRCQTVGGVALHQHDVLRAALSGHIRRVVMDSDRVVIDMGRRQRLFTGNARFAAQLSASRCEHVGCDLPADFCDVDHVDEWDRDNGPTDQRNAAVLCGFDNNDKHRSRWRTRRATNGCSYTFDTDGVILLPVGARPPNFSDDIAESGADPDADPVDPDDQPERIARLTSLARSRLDVLPRAG